VVLVGDHVTKALVVDDSHEDLNLKKENENTHLLRVHPSHSSAI